VTDKILKSTPVRINITEEELEPVETKRESTSASIVTPSDSKLHSSSKIRNNTNF